jgi:hypothetical protein
MSTFGRAQLTDRRTPSTLLCFTTSTAEGTSWQVIMIMMNDLVVFVR